MVRNAKRMGADQDRQDSAVGVRDHQLQEKMEVGIPRTSYKIGSRILEK